MELDRIGDGINIDVTKFVKGMAKVERLKCRFSVANQFGQTTDEERRMMKFGTNPKCRAVYSDADKPYPQEVSDGE